jgi:predicted AlkP superfamily pyrophosphatase or phosphodiesterase
MKTLLRKIATALLLAGLFLGSSLAGAAPTQPARPKLVVLIVIDGLPQRQIEANRAQFVKDGFARFLDRGSWFANAHYDHAFTVTAAGHAVLLSGASPSRSGIIGNEWRDPDTGEPMYCAQDRSATYIGQRNRPQDGTSPNNLKVQTVGDVLRRADPRSRVIAVSGKDRGAILPAGKSGTAYMYMSSTGQFASSTYYMSAHPAWVERFNAAKPADRYFKTSWTGSAAGLPILYGAPQDDAPGLRYYGSLLQGPFADALVLDFARAALSGEALGQREVPDILVVSLSGHDYVNHAFSAESELSQDHTLQVDRLLQDFFRDLDARVGPDNYIAALSADHGFMPTPEYSLKLGLEAGRIASGSLLARINAALEQRLGPGKWVTGFSAASLALNRPWIAQQKLEAAAVAQQVKTLLLQESGIAAAYTRDELLGGQRSAEPLFARMRKSWHPDVSGDVQFALKPNWMFGAGNLGATHGSPYDYDTHVPLMLWGPRWVRAAALSARVGIVDLAPTLARFLHIASPADSEGRPLPLLDP